MIWRGFLHESKQYMNYRGMNVFQKCGFWMEYPFALRRFCKFQNERGQG